MKLRIVFALLLLMATIPLVAAQADRCGTKYPSDEEVAEIEKVLRAGSPMSSRA